MGMTQFNGMDSVLLFYEQLGITQNMTGVFVYDPSTAPGGRVDFDKFVKYMDARLERMPVYRRRLYRVPFDLDRPYWLEDPDVDISRHVHRIALPGRKDMQELRALTAYLHALPLDQTKPLWEMYFLEGLDNVEGFPPGCFALAQKMHHTSIDGLTGMHMMEIMHDLDRKPGKVPKTRHTPERAQPDPVAIVTNALRGQLELPGRVLTMVKGILASREGMKRFETEWPDYDRKLEVPVTRFQGRIGRERVIGGLALDFQELRGIKSAVADATINDAMLSVVAGALRKYLASKDELPETSLVCGCAVDIRKPDQKSAEGNVVGLMRVRIRTDLADPLERLAAVHQDAVRAKALANAGQANFFQNLFGALPNPLIGLAARGLASEFVARKAIMGNTMLSNMPGPTKQLYLAGAKLVGFLAAPPLEVGGTGLMHTAISNVMDGKGVIDLDFVSTPEMLPDPSFYRQCLQESYDELKHAAGRVGGRQAASKTEVRRSARRSRR